MYETTLKTATGKITFSYVISTPTQTAVKKIPKSERGAPTIVFLHPVYIGKVIYHPQFSDRQLRRFNLVALDLRCHAKTSGRAGPGYGREVAARDVAQFMASLDIAQYHIFGMSMGGCIGIQTAILFPANVKSVFVVSSLPLTEPEDVAAGRQEIYDCWEEGAKNNGGKGDLKAADSAMRDAFTGAAQLSVNGEQNDMFDAILARSIELLGDKWSRERLEDWQVCTVDFFTLRKAYTIEALSKIQCPIRLLHCGADIAYPLETTEEVANRLRIAGVRDVSVQQIAGAPHFGAVTHPREINALFHAFILSIVPPTSVPPMPARDRIQSPWLNDLKKCGLDPDSESEEEE
ncbi:AB hydrolase-1 domain-containing protein [Mycena indigotica]|uniref:AB hydrolase-1 domain-containing protein n=1 Tax=Mycena indigotica TaxID=2126181 RepID=A0A8H6SEK4_9AGAR|nr:AB hydrolase-1 domain-containing protein [Mycena indigotica]KAF7297503.1 AB hydrolase-1 domain-containing protein [Mycena indigotica]